MSTSEVFAIGLAGAALFLMGWLGWQLLRQNGRILLRLDELEQRLNELEFGGDEEPEGLLLGSEAPTFDLPDLAGERKSLAQFRGQPVLLIFFNPDCGFCRELSPKLAALDIGSRRGVEADPTISQANNRLLTSSATAGQPLPLLLSTGDAEKNRQFFAEHKVSYPVLLQTDGEVAKAYQTHGTPSGYLIGPDGKIASELVMGVDALLKLARGNSAHEPDHPHTSTLSPDGGEGVWRTGEGESPDPANRFSKRSLTRSKLKRDGLKVGTPAPDFRLPRLDGQGDLTLSELRGKRVLLVFSSPGCGPCNALAPELEAFHRKQTRREVGRVTPCAPREGEVFKNGAQRTARPTHETVVAMISRGEPKENRAKVKEHGLTFPVVLQRQWEISRRYAMFATPIAYLVDEQGVILNDVAVGVDAIQALMAEVRHRPEPAVLLDSKWATCSSHPKARS